MESPIYHRNEPPYTWLRAYEYKDRKKLKFRRLQVGSKVRQDIPTILESYVKIVQAAFLQVGAGFDIGIYVGMSWNVFKTHALAGLKHLQTEIKIDVDKIQDVVFSNGPHDLSPGVDSTKHDLYVVIPDNTIVFISQILRTSKNMNPSNRRFVSLKLPLKV